MLKVEAETIRNLRSILLILEAVTGLKVNLHKSFLSHVGSVPNLEELASLFGCQIAALAITYLGLSLGAKALSKAIWILVLEKLGKKLTLEGAPTFQRWKACATKNVLSSIPIYHLSLFVLPASVTAQIERLQRSFFVTRIVTARKSVGLARRRYVGLFAMGAWMVGTLRKQTELCLANGCGDLDQSVIPSGDIWLLPSMERIGMGGCLLFC